jgi:glycosyltransferase involved in cell wall biosynthesis
VAVFLLRQRKRFDLIQTTYLYWETVVAALLKPLLTARLVVRIIIPGQEGDIDRFRALRLWPLSNAWRRMLLERLLALVLRRADAFVPQTLQGRDELIRLGVPMTRCHVVPNGVDVARFAATPRPPTQGEPRKIVCLARLVRQKGLDVLLEALPTIRAAVGPIVVTICGEGPEGPTLAALAERLGVGGEVCFAGAVEDVVPHLAPAELFVLPSRYEGMPFALLEAMAAGLPVVATAVPGNAFIVRDCVDGLLVPPEDPDALAAAIVRVLREPGLAIRLGAAARLRVASDFDAERMVDRTLTAYRDTLGLDPRS